MTFAEFREKFSRTALLPIRGKLVSEGTVIILTDRDLEILIRYLQHEMKALVTGKLDASKYDNELQDNELVSPKKKQRNTTLDFFEIMQRFFLYYIFFFDKICNSCFILLVFR